MKNNIMRLPENESLSGVDIKKKMLDFSMSSTTCHISDSNKANHLMYKDDIRLFLQNQKEIEILINTFKTCRDNIRTESGIDKYEKFIMHKDMHM